MFLAFDARLILLDINDDRIELDNVVLTTELNDASKLISDFLQPAEELKAKLRAMALNGASGHLIHVVDPAEFAFPYAGRVEFTDPETNVKLTAGNAEAMRAGYEELFSGHIGAVRAAAAALGWSHTLHMTDKLASQALSAMHMHLTQGRGLR